MLAGIRVELYAGCCQSRALSYTFTDATGYYLLAGLPTGNWTVGVVDPNGHYARLFAGNQPTREQAAYFWDIFGKAEPHTNVDLALTAGGTIRGRVLDKAGKPVPGLYVQSYFMMAGFPIFIAADVRTAADGSYALTGLYPGVYRLCFDQAFASTTRECLGTPDTPYPEYDDTISIPVAAGQTVSNVNLTWGPNALIYLPSIAKN